MLNLIFLLKYHARIEIQIYFLTLNSLKLDLSSCCKSNIEILLIYIPQLDWTYLVSSSSKKCICVINQCILYYNSPLGNSCGVTSSLKNSCAMLGCSVSESVSVNQNWRVLCSCVCFPVCALTRNTLNCRQSWAGRTSPFVTVRI